MPNMRLMRKNHAPQGTKAAPWVSKGEAGRKVSADAMAPKRSGNFLDMYPPKPKGLLNRVKPNRASSAKLLNGEPGMRATADVMTPKRRRKRRRKPMGMHHPKGMRERVAKLSEKKRLNLKVRC